METGYVAVRKSTQDVKEFKDYTKKNRAHCCYLMALGNIGLQNREKAAEFLNEALEIEPSHMMATLYQKQ